MHVRAKMAFIRRYRFLWWKWECGKVAGLLAIYIVDNIKNSEYTKISNPDEISNIEFLLTVVVVWVVLKNLYIIKLLWFDRNQANEYIA